MIYKWKVVTEIFHLLHKNHFNINSKEKKINVKRQVPDAFKFILFIFNCSFLIINIHTQSYIFVGRGLIYF